MKIEAIKDFGSYKKGDTIKNMHVTTANALKAHGLVKINNGRKKKEED